MTSDPEPISAYNDRQILEHKTEEIEMPVLDFTACCNTESAKFVNSLRQIDSLERRDAILTAYLQSPEESKQRAALIAISCLPRSRQRMFLSLIAALTISTSDRVIPMAVFLTLSFVDPERYSVEGMDEKVDSILDDVGKDWARNNFVCDLDGRA